MEYSTVNLRGLLEPNGINIFNDFQKMYPGLCNVLLEELMDPIRLEVNELNAELNLVSKENWG